MIRVMDDLPENVVGFEAFGKVTADDYESVVLPAVDHARKSDGGLRVLYVLGDGFEGFEAEAALDDMKMGLHNWSAFERIAMVTDENSYRVMSKAFGFLMHGEVRVFPTSESSEAKTWVSQ